MSTRAELAKLVERAYAYSEQISSRSALDYLHNVVIDSQPEPRAFRLVAEQWQWDLLSKVIPALEAVAGVRKDYTGPRSFWFTLPRGHDKTSSIGRLAAWVLAFARRKVTGIVGAADREQAGLVAEFMENEAKLNSWLKRRLIFRNNKVEGQNDSVLKVLSADAFSSFGLKADLIILDELTHWPTDALWRTLLSGRDKRPESVMIVITNAGMMNSWQHKVLQEAKLDTKDWYVFEAPRRLASWMNSDRTESMRRMLPPAFARRVLDNQWLDPSEDCGYVSRGECGMCVETGTSLGLVRREKGEIGIDYVAAIDLGLVHDRTVMTVGHRDDCNRVIIDKMDVICGTAQNRVRIETVEAWIDDVRRKFYKPTLVVDPFQMEGTIQRFEGRMPVERFEARGGKSNYELAQNLRGLIISGRLAWYAGCGEVIRNGSISTLVDEFASVVIRTMNYGYRIDTVGDNFDDRVICLGMMALKCTQMTGKTKLLIDGFF